MEEIKTLLNLTEYISNLSETDLHMQKFKIECEVHKNLFIMTT